ncbi:MAG: 1,4-alpha-glucan branching enzyme, partial [Rhodothermales bacterium]|nr:1,4-alpha-glucan branching enzyme [Rhodothermales bacterium]
HTTYEYSDPLMRYHPDWGTYVFDYGMPGVRNFLVSNAAFWFEKYHIDGLRVDAVASMLYRDYSRQEWRPNQYGGRENLEAISLMKETNEEVFRRFENVMMIAEESTAWPGVSAPTYAGGLGFLYKWNMGWMHDTLEYMRRDPVHRKYHHNDLTFPLIYAFAENFILPLSHDEVVHGKGSLWSKMPGDDWQKAANLRLLYGHMFGHPGKKLLFMGAEVGQYGEWSHDGQVHWELLKNPLHAGITDWIRSLNRLYRTSKPLWNDKPGGFEWIDFQDHTSSIVSYLRKSDDDHLVFVFNFTPVPRAHYRIGVPDQGTWEVLLNSNEERFGGSGYGQSGKVKSEEKEMHGRPYSVNLEIPPLGVLILKQA